MVIINDIISGGTTVGPVLVPPHTVPCRRVMTPLSSLRCGLVRPVGLGQGRHMQSRPHAPEVDTLKGQPEMITQ